jgi:signal transduction histidine kinase/ActR/RegA family two-component response regulator
MLGLGREFIAERPFPRLAERSGASRDVGDLGGTSASNARLARSGKLAEAFAALSARLRDSGEKVAFERLRAESEGGGALQLALDLEDAHEALKAVYDQMRALHQQLREASADRGERAEPRPCVAPLSGERAEPRSCVAPLSGERAEPVDRASVLRGEVLATLAHEMRSPLNAVLGWTRLLRRDRVKAHERARALTTIEHNASVLSSLIDDALDAARIGQGRIELRWSRAELGAIVDAIAYALRPAAEAKGVRVCVELANPDCVIDGDPARLHQIVYNLVSNSLKFTPSGGKIGISLACDGRRATLIVSDTGQGILPDALPHVFDPFRQCSDVAAARGGLGIGLAVVRELVELHGGAIRCESGGFGQGTAFTVTFPQLSARSSRVDEDRASIDGAMATRLGGFRVLLVDDNDDARHVTQAILESAGAEVLPVPTGASALDRLRSWRPDVLLSDLSMPEIDGFELIRLVRTMEADDGGRVPAVAITASGHVEDARRAIVAGFQLIVKKPVDPTVLVGAIASAVEFRMR